MTIPLPPSIRADVLVLRRAGWIAVAIPFVAPALLVLGCAILVCGSWYRGWGWCVSASAALALAGSFALARGRLTGLLQRSCFGWCGACPVPARTATAALLALTIAALAVAIVWGSLLLAIAAMPAPHPLNLGLGLLAVDGGLAIGTLFAAAAALRRGAVVRSRHAEGIREPLLALAWLDDRRLPHVVDWQRRAALVTWRRGSSALAAVVLVAVPDSASIPAIVGLLLLVSSLVWLDVVMRACATAATEAVRLLAATPVMAVRGRSASLRYPLVATACALVLAIVGAILMDGGPAAVPIWCGCAIAASAWPVGRFLRTTEPRHPQ